MATSRRADTKAIVVWALTREIPTEREPDPVVERVRRKTGRGRVERIAEDFTDAARRMIARARDPEFRAEMERRERQHALYEEQLRAYARQPVEAVAQEPEPEPELSMQDRIIEALAGAGDPLSGKGVRRLVGGSRGRVYRTLNEMLAEGLLTRSPGPRGAHLWALAEAVPEVVPAVAAGTQNEAVPPSGPGRVTTSPPLGPVTSDLGPRRIESREARRKEGEMDEVIVHGETVEERAASIVTLFKAGVIGREDSPVCDDFDFGYLALHVKNPDFALAWDILTKEVA